MGKRAAQPQQAEPRPSSHPALRQLAGTDQAEEEPAARYGRLPDLLVLSLGDRLRRAKRSYATRRIGIEQGQRLLVDDIVPQSGDLVLARVERLGHHRRLEDPNGRRCRLYPGDQVLLCFAARYASDQFNAVVPDALEPCHLVAAGGIAAQCLSRHADTRPPTEITPLGLVARADGTTLNLKDFARNVVPAGRPRPRSLAVVGTSMNAGKTTTAATLVYGLTCAGTKVGVGKITGTGAGGDRWAYIDAGAYAVLDFTDFGYASTFMLPTATVEDVAGQIVDALTSAGADAIVLEVADGLYFEETGRFVQSRRFAALVDEVILAAGDAMSALAGEQWLVRAGLAPSAITGRITSSPLAVREAERLLAAPIITRQALSAGHWAHQAFKLTA